MPQQTISYNSFVFPHPRLRVVEQPLWDDAGVAQIGTQFTFEVTGHVTGNTLADLEQELTCMRARLMQPRKEFFVEWAEDAGGGTERLWSFDGTANADWGPVPGDLRLDRFAGGRAAMYAWSMTVTAKDCANACVISNTSADILATTRVWTHAVDEDGFTTRTISGKLLVKASAVQAGRGADYYRYRLVPGVPSNYRRTQQQFVQSADGRELTFHVVDVEQMWTLPLPISSGNADFAVRLADLGMIADYRLSGRFKAPASISKATIIDRIFALIAAKFPLSQTGFFFEDREFVDHVYDNAISFNVSARAAVGVTAGGTPDFAAALNQLTVTPPNSTGVSQTISPYGGDGTVTSGVIAQAAKAYDACSPAPNPSPSSYEGGSVAPEPGATTPPTGTPGTSQPTGVSEYHLNSPFESLHEEVRYEVDNMIVMLMPMTKGNAPIKQQTGIPSVTVIQSGYFRQYARSAADVSPPPKPKLGANGVVLRASPGASTPQPVGDGTTNLYRVSWMYVVQYTRELPDAKLTDVEPTFPIDLRRPSNGQDVGERLPTLPDVAVIPA